MKYTVHLQIVYSPGSRVLDLHEILPDRAGNIKRHAKLTHTLGGGFLFPRGRLHPIAWAGFGKDF